MKPARCQPPLGQKRQTVPGHDGHCGGRVLCNEWELNMNGALIDNESLRCGADRLTSVTNSNACASVSARLSPAAI